MIKMIYITCDTSIAHYSTWQFSVETWKTATFDTHTVYYSMKYDSHLLEILQSQSQDTLVNWNIKKNQY